MFNPHLIKTATLSVLLVNLSTAQTPIICEDNISGQLPFKSEAVPCVLECDSQVAVATEGLLPGSVNETDIPYCELDCVRSDASPAQSSAAPGCYAECQKRNSATPEQLGWCMYWCVQGGEIEQLVISTTCVPSIEWVPATTRFGTETEVVTYEGFSEPAAWPSWYATQTAIPRTSLFVFATAAPASGSSTSLIVAPSSLSTSPQTTADAMSDAASQVSSSAFVTDATALGDGASLPPSSTTVTATTSTSGSMSWSSAWPALAVALLFAVVCF